MLDIIIKNGYIVDGTGNPSYKGSLGIKDGKVVKIESNIAEEALEIIDATELIVCPGFIDVHSHNDLVPFMDENIQNLKLMQGVTTELVGQCGLGVIPCVETENNIWKNYIRGVVGDPPFKWGFSNLDDYINQITLKGLKNNFTILISHEAIKTSVMNFDSRIPTKEEINTMCAIAEDAMKSGAFGMSIGLQYTPAIFSTNDFFIGKFVRDKKVLSLENAIYKISYLPAKTLDLKDIGELAVGKTADIVLFDFKKIKGFENYFKPTTAPIGMKFVILNGNIAVNDSVVCQSNYGKVYRNNK